MDHPPAPRTLVLCFDGTASQFDADNTNVVKLFSLLRREDTDRQRIFYQPGVGTYSKPGILTPLLLWLSKVIDQAIAWFLDEHVLGGYEFLMDNYRPGDKICMFGFSRGAYTVRALAGMLHKVGLLPKGNKQQVPFAYRMYKRTDKAGFEQSRAFKRTFSRSVEIEFIGLWDTVASVGLIHQRRLPFTLSNYTVRTFRHALSLDERRSRFRPCLWGFAPHSKPDGAVHSAPGSPTPVLRIVPEVETESLDMVIKATEGVTITHARDDSGLISPPVSPPPHTSSAPNLHVDHEPSTSSAAAPLRPDRTGRLSFRKLRKTRRVRSIDQEAELEHEFDSEGDVTEDWKYRAGKGSIIRQTDALEVWFSGNHSDVGGGQLPDTEQKSISNIPLHWMIREAVLSQSGILFDAAALARLGVPLGAFALTSPLSRTSSHTPSLGREPLRSPSPGPTTSALGLNVHGDDALCDLHDELKAHPVWWLLEVLPSVYWYQNEHGHWKRTRKPNMGRPRVISTERPFVHHSVHQRMTTERLHYTPHAQWKGEPNWVL